MKKLIVFSLLVLALTACSGLSQPTPAPAPTQTLTPFPEPTATPAPTSTLPPPTETPDLVAELMPEGEPASEWKGIPIMPEALAGEGDEESYVFTVQATSQQVQEYYQRELGKLGWQLSARGAGSNASLMLIFLDNTSTMLTVSILVKGDGSLVLLVK